MTMFIYAQILLIIYLEDKNNVFIQRKDEVLPLMIGNVCAANFLKRTVHLPDALISRLFPVARLYIINV